MQVGYIFHPRFHGREHARPPFAIIESGTRSGFGGLPRKFANADLCSRSGINGREFEEHAVKPTIIDRVIASPRKFEPMWALCVDNLYWEGSGKVMEVPAHFCPGFHPSLGTPGSEILRQLFRVGYRFIDQIYRFGNMPRHGKGQFVDGIL